MRHKLAAALFALAWVVVALACGARSELEVGDPRRAGEGGGGGPPECVVYNSSAELAPLDVFIMLDASGSMQFPTGSGLAKWWAVRDALNAFFYDGESRGIGVALSFFPIVNPNVPEICSDDANCGVADACIPLYGCPTTLSSCVTDEDCDAEGNGDACEPLGLCQGTTAQVVCVEGSLPCDPGQGPCVPIGTCENRFTCEAGPYEEPVVDVATLPNAAAAILAMIDSKTTEGGTPTLPALTGAVNHAILHHAANESHKVIVVLATDGVPTVCDPAIHDMEPRLALAHLQEAAAAGQREGNQTFVIGVFAPEEQGAAEPSLSAIAEAGGTGAPFIVNTAGEVTGEFRDALNQVRLTAKACEFAIPVGDEPVDYDGIWVRIPQGSDETWVARVGGQAACDPIDGGFYYDVPIDGPVPPERIILCPATCTLLGSSPNRTVEIFTTCSNPMQ